MSAFKIVLLSCVAAYHSACLSAEDCAFPDRAGVGNEVVYDRTIVNAANGGAWEKVNPRSQTLEKGTFRFIYYKQGRAYPVNRLFLEAWQHKAVGHDVFVGCVEIKDEEIAKDVELARIAFRTAERDSIDLDMSLYDPNIKARPYTIRVPLDFIDTFPDNFSQ